MDFLIDGIRQESSWVLQAIAVLIAVALLHFLFLRLFALRKRRLALHGVLWKAALWRALPTPFFSLLWTAALFWIFTILEVRWGWKLFLPVVTKTAELITLGMITWFFVRWVRFARQDVLKGSAGEELAKFDLIFKFLLLLIWIIALLSGLQLLGFNVQTLATIGGISGFSLGFAAKDVISNFFGGVMLYITRPFAIGDTIRSPDKQIQGVVLDISWYYTVIRTDDKEPLFVPNALFSTIIVVNHSRLSHWMLTERLTLRYEDLKQVQEIVKRVQVFFKEHPRVDHKEDISVHLDRLGDSGVDLVFKIATLATKRVEAMKIKQELLLGISKIVQEVGADFSFPTFHIRLANN